MSGFILPLAEGESRPARSAAAGGQFGDFLCKARSAIYQLDRAAQSRLHARRIGFTFAGNRERRSVIRRRPNIRQSERDVGRFSVGNHLYRDQTLIMIRRDNQVELARVRTKIQAVRRVRSGYIDVFRGALSDGGSKNVDVLTPEHSTFPRMRIDSRNSDWSGCELEALQLSVDKSDQPDIVIHGEMRKSFSQRHVDCREDNLESGCEERQ